MSVNNGKITFLQHNTARNIANMHTCLQIGIERNIDFILLQEPYIGNDNITASNAAYHCILPQTTLPAKPRVLIYAKKQFCFNYCQLTDEINDPDMLILQISCPGIQKFKLLNVYNHR